MAYKNIAAKDANSNPVTFRGQDNGDGTVSVVHLEDQTQRSGLLSELASKATAALQTASNALLTTISTKLDSLATSALQAAANTTLTSLAAKLDVANARQGLAASIGGTISATGPTASVAVRGDFNVSFSGTFSGSLVIERSFDNTVWLPLTAIGTPVTFNTPATEIFSEPEAGVRYRLNCTSLTSGSIVWRISQ